MTRLASPLSAFLREYLPRDRGASRHTVESYATSFRLLAVFAAERHSTRPCMLEIGHLDTGTILAFLDHLEAKRRNSIGTRNIRLAAVKSFFRFLEFHYPAYLDMAAQLRAIPQKKRDVPALRYLGRNEVAALLGAPDTTTRAGIRDRSMLYLAYNGGLRVSELVGLGMGDVRMPGEGEVRVLGEGRRTRTLPLWKETGRALASWLAIRSEIADRHLFLNSMGRGMTRRGFA